MSVGVLRRRHRVGLQLRCGLQPLRSRRLQEHASDVGSSGSPPLEAGMRYSGRFKILDSFRGLAILWVMVFHLAAPHRDDYGYVFEVIARHLYMGVFIFFVISGFGIAAVVRKTIEERGSTWGFLVRRFERIYSPHLFALAFAALIIPTAIALFPVLKGNPPQFVHYYDYSPSQWLGIATLSKPLFDDGKITDSFRPMNISLWYIAVIIQIYSAVALTLCLRQSAFRAIFAVALASLVLMSQQYSAWIPAGLFIRYWLPFCIGVALNCIIETDRRLTASGRTAGLLAILFSSGIVAVLWWTELIQHSSLLFCLLLALLLWVLHPFDGMLSRNPIMRLLAFFGTFSYSLFLMHIPFGRLFLVVLARSPLVCSIPEVVRFPALLFPMVIVSCFVWYVYFEKPQSLRGTGISLVNPLASLRRAFVTA